MRFAISTDGHDVSAHFGRCPQFTIGDIQNGLLIRKEVLRNPGHHPGFLPVFLHEKGVECIIAGGMGARALELFAAQGITPLLGVSGSVDDAIAKLCKGELKGGVSSCAPRTGKGYGVEKTECTHGEHEH